MISRRQMIASGAAGALMTARSAATEELYPSMPAELGSFYPIQKKPKEVDADLTRLANLFSTISKPLRTANGCTLR